MEAAKAHLKAGRPIYYEDPAYPDQVVKQYPDGRRQLVRFKRPSGEEVVQGSLGEHIHHVRGRPVPDTDEQRDWVQAFGVGLVDAMRRGR